MAGRDIEFDAEGVTLRGWHYRPDEAAGAVPTIVMAHGFSAVKEMYLDAYAEAFAAAGLAALVFDNRNFGASDGEPRQEIDPWPQVRDYRDAITFASTLPETDAAAHRRLGIELQRRPRPRRRRDRPAGRGRGRPGAADQRARNVRAAGPRRLHRRVPRACSTPTARPASAGKPPAMVPVVAEDPLGAVGAADAGLAGSGSPRPAEPRARRGATR